MMITEETERRQNDSIALTTDIVAAYVGHRRVPATVHSVVMLAIARRLKNRFALFVISPFSGFAAATLWWAAIGLAVGGSVLTMDALEWWRINAEFGLSGIVPAIVCSLIVEALRWRRRRINMQMPTATGS